MGGEEVEEEVEEVEEEEVEKMAGRGAGSRMKRRRAEDYTKSSYELLIIQMPQQATTGYMLASFPGLPHLQLLIASSMQKLEAIKSWRCGRPENEAITCMQGIRFHQLTTRMSE